MPGLNRRIIRLFRPYRGRLTTVLILIAFSAALGMVSPFLLRDILDVAIPENRDGLLLALVGGMIGISIVTAVLGVGQTWLTNVVGQRVMHDLRTQVYRHLQRLVAGVLHPHPHGRDPVADRQRHRRRAVRGHVAPPPRSSPT